MENNNYLSSGVNYIPLTVLDKQHTLFTTANGGAYDPLAFDDIKVGSNGRYCFGFADPSQFRFYNASTGEYNVAGIAREAEDSGIFINNTGERGIQVWLYFGDNYDQDSAVLSSGSEGTFTDPDGGTIGYWQKYAYIRPHERATIPWIKDDEVGTQSNRMYFQYRNGNVSASSYEEWDGSGGTHNREWTYSNSSGYTYGSTDLVPLTYNNLIELEQNSFDAGLDAIAIRCMAVQGSLLLDSTPMDGRVDKDVLIKDTDSDIYVDDTRLGDIFDGKLWGPISSDYYEIDDLLYATPNGDKVTWGMTLERVISGDAQSRSHFLLNGLEINPQTVIYNSAADQTTFSIQIAWPDEMYGGSEGVDIVSFEHYFARTEAEVVSGFVEGSYIAGATVEAKSKSGETISTITDEFGYYEFNEPVVGIITAKGGYSTITGEIIDDNTSDDIISTGDLTTIQAPRKTHSNLGGIINSATSIMAELMDKQAMNKQEAISAFRESAVTLYDLESDVTDNDLDQYMRIGLAGLQNSADNDVQIFAKMTKLIKAVSEGEQSFADGGTSNNSSSKAKRKVANIYRKNLVDIIAKGASGKIVEVANSYDTEVGGDSNLGSISNSEFGQNSKEDLIYLINAKAIEEVDSKITSTDKNLGSKSAWKDTSKVLADSLAANRYDDAASVKNKTYEEIFVHYNEKAMQRKQGARNLFNRKRQNASISTSDFASKLNNDSFSINIENSGYTINGSIVTSRGDEISKDSFVDVKYSDDNVSQRNAKVSKQGSIIELNKGKEAGEVSESEDVRDVTTLTFGTGFARAVYLIGNTTTLAYHNVNQHEVVINDEFFTKIGDTIWNGQAADQWFNDDSFAEWYPDKVGVLENDLYPSTFRGKYKVIYGPNIKIKDENGNLRNWNIVDYRKGRSIAAPGSIEEFQLLEYIYEILTDSNGLTNAPADLWNIVNEAYRDHVFFDTDGDGVADVRDAFPNDATEIADSDEDGVGDNADAFPNDASETVDSDSDGVGDNTDAFPNDASETKDSDGDGVGDNTDAFPNDASETRDSDKDGVGDNTDAFPNDASETVDSDSDGTGDNKDAFPNDATETADSDEDGVGDNADAFPNDPTETVDTDGDGTGDNADTDDDNDTYSDEDEIEAGTDPKDSEDFPASTVSPQGRQSAELTRNLKGFFTTNESGSYSGTGTTINEMSGLKNSTNATLRNGVSYVNDDTSVNVPYFVFDGVDDHFSWAHNPNIKLGIGNEGPGMTYSMWIKPNAKTAHIINNDAYGTSYYYGVNIGIYSDGRIFTNEMNQGHPQRKGKYNRDLTLFETVDGKNPLTDAMANGDWVHVCITYTDFGGGRNKALYINGQLWNSIANGNGFASSYRRYVDYTTTNGGSVGIMGASVAYYSGGFESVKIFEGPLSARDVEDEFNARKGLFNLGGE